jgi:hypothetical protein
MKIMYFNHFQISQVPVRIKIFLNFKKISFCFGYTVLSFPPPPLLSFHLLFSFKFLFFIPTMIVLLPFFLIN